ncbi:unnamed protein product [Closterium sp. NIES-54]
MGNRIIRVIRMGCRTDPCGESDQPDQPGREPGREPDRPFHPDGKPDHPGHPGREPDRPDRPDGEPDHPGHPDGVLNRPRGESDQPGGVPGREPDQPFHLTGNRIIRTGRITRVGTE